LLHVVETAIASVFKESTVSVQALVSAEDKVQDNGLALWDGQNGKTWWSCSAATRK